MVDMLQNIFNTLYILCWTTTAARNLNLWKNVVVHAQKNTYNKMFESIGIVFIFHFLLIKSRKWLVTYSLHLALIFISSFRLFVALSIEVAFRNYSDTKIFFPRKKATKVWKHDMSSENLVK